MAPQLSDHRRVRTWAISGAVVAFTVVVGVIARDQLAPFARGVADGTYRIAQLLKNGSQP